METRLVAKWFILHDIMDYVEIFIAVSSRESYRNIMALVAHFDMEVRHIDAKAALWWVFKEVYMSRLEGFEQESQEYLFWKLNKYLYELRQASRRNFLVNTSYKNKVDQRIYLHINASKLIIFVL